MTALWHPKKNALSKGLRANRAYCLVALLLCHLLDPLKKTRAGEAPLRFTDPWIPLLWGEDSGFVDVRSEEEAHG